MSAMSTTHRTNPKLTAFTVGRAVSADSIEAVH
jgi:hypothetical protein